MNRLESLFKGAWVAWACAVVLAPLMAALGLEQATEVLYAFLGIGCHQDPERSFHIFGEALGVCHRCSGIGLGIGVGLVALKAPHSRLRLSWRMLTSTIAAASILLVVDVLGESNSTMRVLTGVLFGVFVTMGLLLVSGIKRMVGYAFLVTPLLACGGASTAIRPPAPPKVKALFDASSLEWSKTPGTGKVTGQAFLKTRGGDVKKGAGNVVYLVPACTYTKEWVTLRHFGQMVQPAPEATPYFRQSVSDADGRFVFKDLPPGQWYAVTTVTWEVPQVIGGKYPYTYMETQGGVLVGVVTLGEGAEVDMILTY